MQVRACESNPWPGASSHSRVKGSASNIAQDGIAVDSLLSQFLKDTNQSLVDLPTEVVKTPFVTVPLGVMEDALVGSVDLEQSLETGQHADCIGSRQGGHAIVTRTTPTRSSVASDIDNEKTMLRASFGYIFIRVCGMHMDLVTPSR